MNLLELAAFKRGTKHLLSCNIIGTVPIDIVFVTAESPDNPRFYMALRRSANPSEDLLVKWYTKNGLWAFIDKDFASEIVGALGCGKKALIEAFSLAFDKGKESGVIGENFTKEGISELFERKQGGNVYTNSGGQIGAFGPNAQAHGNVFQQTVYTGNPPTRRNLDNDDD